MPAKTPDRHPDEVDDAGNRQFSIGYLLLLCAVVAAILGFRRALGGIAGDLCALLLAVISLLAMMTRGRTIWGALAGFVIGSLVLGPQLTQLPTTDSRYAGVVLTAGIYAAACLSALVCLTGQRRIEGVLVLIGLLGVAACALLF